ncbi:MAG: imidazolonepropionase, partial [Ktedonobacteraceae bacterium]|nr:imidazolonepropionase [Ktedonobacteraceae bacterium]
GFVDSHTHLLFAGSRAAEFHLRRQGVSYSELLAQGRGILATVQATREASADTLTQLALQRLNTLRDYGTTTIEIKTGYGLDVTTEETCLRLINGLNAHEAVTQGLQGLEKVRVVPTFLGAHTIPPEYRDRRSAYIDVLTDEM